jgi:PST family polysaccharide transporter
MKKRENFKKDVKAGIAWSFLERGGVQLLHFIASIILARILSPSDFGVLGVAVLFTGVSGRFASLSFGMAILQRDEVRPDHHATLFVSQLVINSTVFMALVLASPWVGEYFGNPLIGDVLALSAVNFLIRIIGGCPSVLLRRGMGFRAMSISNVLDAFVDMCVAVSMGLLGFGVWSLVYGALFGAFASNVYLVWASKWRPSLRVTRKAFNEMFRFGAGVSVADLITFASERTANFVIGKALGTAALGHYDKGYGLIARPLKDLSNRVNRVLFPVFARIRHEPGRFRSAFRRAMLGVSLLGYPVFFSLLVLAPQVIAVLFGPQWTPAIVPFQILCVSGVVKLVQELLIAVTFVSGSSGHEVKRRLAVVSLMLVSCMIGLRWGLPGVAAALVAVNAIGLVVAMWQVGRLGLLRPVADVIAPQGIPFCAAVAMVLAERGVQLWTLSVDLNAFAVLTGSLAAGAAAYLAVIALMKDETLTNLLTDVLGDVAPLTERVPMIGTLTRRFRQTPAA